LGAEDDRVIGVLSLQRTTTLHIYIEIVKNFTIKNISRSIFNIS